MAAGLRGKQRFKELRIGELTGEPLFAEQAAAWDHGPVVPVLYQEFKNTVLPRFLLLPRGARTISLPSSNLEYWDQSRKCADISLR